MTYEMVLFLMHALASLMISILLIKTIKKSVYFVNNTRLDVKLRMSWYVGILILKITYSM